MRWPSFQLVSNVNNVSYQVEVSRFMAYYCNTATCRSSVGPTCIFAGPDCHGLNNVGQILPATSFLNFTNQQPYAVRPLSACSIRLQTSRGYHQLPIRNVQASRTKFAISFCIRSEIMLTDLQVYNNILLCNNKDFTVS